MLKVEGLTHWSIPVNNLEESEKFYRDLLGLEYRGRLGNSSMACLVVGGTQLLLTERKDKIVRTPEQDGRTHHSFTVSPQDWEKAAHLFHDNGVEVDEIVYREKGFFTGREMYFLDPSGNLLEVRDPTWEAGMPKPTYEELLEGPSP
jgi:catechol 2,3-dioxygenase-like lactoylglutathione lyase family enzyme